MSTLSNAPAPEPRDPRADALAATIHADEEAPGRWPARGSVPLTVLVPAKSEASNIVECLRRLRWAEQVAVVDSGSKDDTVALTQAMGCEVYWFDFPNHSPDGWPKKRNWALETLPLRHEWVLFMDADEHMTPELAAEIADVLAGRRKPARGGSGDGWWINRKLIFMGRWIEHCGYYPSWNLRLFKHALGRFERMTTQGDTGSGDMEVHEHVTLATGPAGYLENDFLHYAYADIASWVEKHNRYSSWEAHVAREGHADGLGASPFGNGIERKRWIKQMSRQVPARPTLRFMYHYVLRGGFRDGYPGWVLCRLLGMYEFLSVAKEQELRTRAEDR
ncbi:MAG: glycosyltransferase family 2 protein [Sandaracinaceae bacterium]|nr:glycosyltransferase family 2 protein [Sandaracinaceae bacterium]